MIAACEAKGVPISIDHTRRWWPAYHRVLLRMVGRRRRLLDYLKRRQLQRYQEVIQRLGIRK
jgi:ribosomal protein S15